MQWASTYFIKTKNAKKKTQIEGQCINKRVQIDISHKLTKVP